MPRTASMTTVAMEVISGKRQNSHTMVTADRINIAKSAAIFVRACDESVMPFPPKSHIKVFDTRYTGSVAKRTYSKDPRVSVTHPAELPEHGFAAPVAGG
jgi:hypothetical protein